MGPMPCDAPARPAIEVRSPVDGSVVGVVDEFSEQEIDSVLVRLARHQPEWAARPVDERARVLHQAADALDRHSSELAGLLVMEVAKSRKDAMDEVVRSADFVRHVAEEGRRSVGDAQFSDSFPGQVRNKLAVSYRVPYGVVLAIPPFNYPVNLAVSKVAPGLVAGNTVALKPPTQGSVVGTMLGRLFHQSGIPVDAFQVVTGRGRLIGDYLAGHPLVDMITFTGSSETGKRLTKQAEMVPLLLELGGKDPAIILADADIALAADHAVAGAFAYAGQRCTAVKRVLAVDSVADRLVDAMAERASRLTVGDPRDDATVTPLVDPEAAPRAERLVAQAVARGGRLVCGGGRRGNVVEPTIVDRVTAEMDLAWVEPFAPVLPVIRVGSASEAVQIANRSQYGLQAAVFSQNINTALHLALQLDVGTVQINGRTARGPDHFPFMGTKSSGMGAQGARHSIEAMTRLKSVVFNMQPVDLELLS
jgi:glyceraldehyde-3-phosphate dehydrogenase (NADP+)